ncbi:MAG: TetR/AcrR family transcriptional regulator, partial [Solirubrobacterales bacterium]|nr:TetR/AcrR family transcriptional regulator [Solirubrobacterales bacterium]
AGAVSVAHVVKRSGVSRRTFYETFDGREDCFVAAFEQALAFATERVVAVYDPSAGWLQHIRAGLMALLSFLDEEPHLGRVLIVESLAGGPRLAARRAETMAMLTHVLDEGAAASRAGVGLPELTSEGVAGAVLTVLQNRLLDPQHGPFVVLANQLTSMVVLPYLGTAAARRELQRPLAEPASVVSERESLLSDPFKDVGMRLTYRTVRVLNAIADHPGASNRLIGIVAEIGDQGQISKLLARLGRIGLIANSGVGPERGGPNAWTLTDTGQRVVNIIRAHAATDARAQDGR